MANVEFIESKKKIGSAYSAPKEIKSNWPNSYGELWARKNERFIWVIRTKHRQPFNIKEFKNEIKAVEYLEQYDPQNTCKVVKCSVESLPKEREEKRFQWSGSHRPLDVPDRLFKEANDREDRLNLLQYNAEQNRVKSAAERAGDRKFMKNFINTRGLI